MNLSSKESDTRAALMAGFALLLSASTACAWQGVFMQTQNVPQAFPVPTTSVATDRYTGATELADGRALIAEYNSLAIYDPVSGSFGTPVFEPYGRAYPHATLLTNGKVLLTGGIAPAELFDPVANSVSLTSGPMTSPRAQESVTRFADGRVLIAGGVVCTDASCNQEVISNTTEFYDPTSGTFQAGPSMLYARYGHNAVLLPDGRVFILGGTGTNGPVPLEIFDPITNSFSLTTNQTTFYRVNAVSTLLQDGRILSSGGQAWYCPILNPCYIAPNLDNQYFIYDPITDQGVGPYSLPGAIASGSTATLLGDGTVLLTGGNNAGGSIFYFSNAGAIFDSSGPTDPTYGQMQLLASTVPPKGRTGAAAARLGDGSVLIAGGNVIDQATSHVVPTVSAVRYMPDEIFKNGFE
jgi:hypothetical protein